MCPAENMKNSDKHGCIDNTDISKKRITKRNPYKSTVIIGHCKLLNWQIIPFSLMQEEMTNHNGNQITDDGQHKKKAHFFQQLTVILHLKGSKNQNRIHNQCAQSGQTLFCIIINDSHLTTDHAYNHNNKNRNNLSKYRCNYHSLCSAFLFNSPFFQLI